MQPTVSVWTQFKNNDNIGPFFANINNFNFPKENLKIFCGVGDHKDDCLEQLQHIAKKDSRVVIVRNSSYVEIPPPPYQVGDIAHKLRLHAISVAANIVYDKIAEEGFGDYVLHMESDLIVRPSILKDLINNMLYDCGGIAPMVWLPLRHGMRFYDGFAFIDQTATVYHERQVRDGISHTYPGAWPVYAPAWFASRFEGLVEMNSVGSYVLWRMQCIKDGARCVSDVSVAEHEMAILGMCKTIREQGYKIYANAELNVIHPNGDLK